MLMSDSILTDDEERRVKTENTKAVQDRMKTTCRNEGNTFLLIATHLPCALSLASHIEHLLHRSPNDKRLDLCWHLKIAVQSESDSSVSTLSHATKMLAASSTKDNRTRGGGRVRVRRDRNECCYCSFCQEGSLVAPFEGVDGSLLPGSWHLRKFGITNTSQRLTYFVVVLRLLNNPMSGWI